MAGPRDIGVPIELDKKRTLRLDLNALAAYEEATGQSVTEIGVTINSVRGLRAMLWGMLLTDEPELTLVEAGALVDPRNIEMVKEKISAALAAGVPQEATGNQETSPKNRQRPRSPGALPTGPSSGPSESMTSD